VRLSLRFSFFDLAGFRRRRIPLASVPIEIFFFNSHFTFCASPNFAFRPFSSVTSPSAHGLVLFRNLLIVKSRTP